MEPMAMPHCDQTLTFSANRCCPSSRRPFSSFSFSLSSSPSVRSSSSSFSSPTSEHVHQTSQNSEPSPSQNFNPFFRFTSLAAITSASALVLLRFWHSSFLNNPILLPPIDSIEESTKQENLATELLGNQLYQVRSVRYCKLKEKAQIVHELIKADARAWQLLKTEVSCCKEKLELVKNGFEAILEKDRFCSKSYHDCVLEYLEMVDECKGLLKHIKVSMDKCERDNLDMKYYIRFFNAWIARVKILEGDMVVALKRFQELEQE